jgi:hypothetical protein
MDYSIDISDPQHDDQLNMESDNDGMFFIYFYDIRLTRFFICLEQRRHRESIAANHHGNDAADVSVDRGLFKMFPHFFLRNLN